MTDDVAHLVLEHLKRFQAQMNRFEDRLSVIETDVRSVKGHLAAFMQTEVHRDADMAALRLRLERIERRLDLID